MPQASACTAPFGAKHVRQGRRLTQTPYNPLLESGAATCSSERRSAGTPIHASIAAPKIINAAATKYPMNNAVMDPVPMIHPNRTEIGRASCRERVEKAGGVGEEIERE